MDAAIPQPKTDTPAKPQVSKPWRIFSRISGIIALALFLTPTIYVLKYYLADQPSEAMLARQFAGSTGAAPLSAHAQTLIDAPDPANVALQERVASHSTDPGLRRRALLAMAAMAGRPGAALRRPMETLIAKAGIANAAAHDPDAGVRTAASDALGAIARQGAVIRR